MNVVFGLILDFFQYYPFAIHVLTFLNSGKPKLFLIEACRGGQLQEKVGESIIYTRITDNDESAQSRNLEQENNFYTDATDYLYHSGASESIPKLPQDADIIVAHATTPGKYIKRLNDGVTNLVTCQSVC